MWCFRNQKMTNNKANMPSYTLIGMEGWFSGEIFHTCGNNTLIGRSPGCQIQIEDPAVSKQHARLYFQDNRWFVEDLDSSNGTYVNSQRVEKSKRLKPNDVIHFGTHSFRFFPGPPEAIPSRSQIFLNRWAWLIITIVVTLGIIGTLLVLFNLLG